MPDVFPLAGGKAHSIPSRNDCARCHLQRMGDPVLGFSALQLSDDREDSKSRTGLTYADLIQMNLISDRPAEQPKIYSSSILGRRAMGYLHANCGNCHNPEGSAGFTGLYFKHFITGTQSEKDEAVEQTAVGRMSGYFHIPGEPLTYRIQAGKPEKSAVWYMMHIRTAGKMPPIGSELVDEAGLSLVSDWITQMN
jgi:mono/diheme cytochrome c family protein